MKLRYSPRLMIFVPLVALTILTAGCGGSDNGVTSKGTGSAIARLVWSTPPTGNTAQALEGVVIVRIIVKGPGMTDLQFDFTASDRSGTINGIAAGTGRTFTAQGLDMNGLVAYQGAAGNITIVAGQLTDVGAVVMLKSKTVSSGDFGAGKFGTAKFGH